MTDRRQTLWSHLGSLWRAQLGVRLVAVLLGGSLVLGGLSSYYSYRSEETVYRDQLLRTGRQLARASALACPDAILNVDKTLLSSFVANLTEDESVAYAWIERKVDSQVLAQSPPFGAPIQASAVMITEPILVAGDHLGNFVLGMALAPMHAQLRARALTLFLQSTLTWLFVAGCLLIVLRRLVIRPLASLDARAQRLGRGDLDVRIPSFGETEIGRLAATMEEMRANLAANHSSLARQNEQLRELDRLKSQFLANMSHEIRTPLNAILGGVELLVDPETTERERADYLRALQWNGTHLLELINTLLDFSKIEEGNLIVEPVPCRPADVVEDVIACMRPLTERHEIELLTDLDPSTATWIATDPMRLRQILINVVGNAVKFTERGSITIAASIRSDARPMLEIEVVDTGIGMPEEFLARLFVPFSQADGSTTRKFGGTGLGLTIARKIANQLGGDIRITSRQGKGTTVHVTVAAPAAPAPVQQQSPADAAAAAARCGGRVLLVEDAPDNQRLMTAMLKKAGVEVDVADNGKIACERVAEAVGRGGYDLILMDIQMPVMDGLTAIRQLRADGVSTPIVALTANAMAEDRDACLQAGGDGYVTKPISRARLAKLLQDHLGKPADVGRNGAGG